MGEGAFARVYRGRHVGLDQTVAIKVLTKVGPGTAEMRFVREAQAAARLTHPHVARVHHLGVDGRYPFIVQEFLEGAALRRIVLERGPLEVKKALRVGRHVARGLIAIHAAGLVHRDIKPGNVMVLRDGSAKIVDFGLVGFLDAPAAGDAQLTREGTMLGTPAFLAPEQAGAKRGAIGPAADVFALGGVLHFALTGLAPHEGEQGASLMELISRRISQPADDIRLLDPAIPAAVAETLHHLLALDPDDRPSMEEALKLIRACSTTQPESDQVPAIPNAPVKTSGRQRTASSARQRTPSTARQRAAPRGRPTSTRINSPAKNPAPVLIAIAAAAALGLGAALLGGRPGAARVAEATPSPSPESAVDLDREAARATPEALPEPVEPIAPTASKPEPEPEPRAAETLPPRAARTLPPRPGPVVASPPAPKPVPAVRAAPAKRDPKPTPPQAKVLPVPKIDPAEVDRAVKRAAAWLIRQQNAKGAFPGFFKEYKDGAETLIAVRALIRAGVKPSHPVIERALTFALGRTLQRVKSVALGMLALEARCTPARTNRARGLSKKVRRRFRRLPVRDRRWLARAVPWLVGLQREDGRWGYPKKKDDPGDLHNTMFAILGLKAAARMGHAIHPGVWLRTASYLLDRQEVDGPEIPAFAIPAADRPIRKRSKPAALPAAFKARGWGYHAPGEKHPKPTRGSVANALTLLAICKSELEGTRPYKTIEGRVTRAIRDGAAVLAERGVERRDSHPVSTLVSVEQAGTLLGIAKFGAHDWYAIGAAWLLEVQSGSGAFEDVGLEDKKWHWAHPIGATSLAILFLRRATLPLLDRAQR